MEPSQRPITGDEDQGNQESPYRARWDSIPRSTIAIWKQWPTTGAYRRNRDGQPLGRNQARMGRNRARLRQAVPRSRERLRGVLRLHDPSGRRRVLRGWKRCAAISAATAMKCNSPYALRVCSSKSTAVGNRCITMDRSTTPKCWQSIKEPFGRRSVVSEATAHGSMATVLGCSSTRPLVARSAYASPGNRVADVLAVSLGFVTDPFRRPAD